MPHRRGSTSSNVPAILGVGVAVAAPVAAKTFMSHVNDVLTALSLIIGIIGGGLVVWRELRKLREKRRGQDDE